jgi:hypothetical protein
LIRDGREGVSGAAVEVVAAESANAAPVIVRSNGHRIVHGGRDFISSVVLDKRVVEDCAGLIPLAALLLPENLQVGCFGIMSTRNVRGWRNHGRRRPVLWLSWHPIPLPKLVDCMGPHARGRAIVMHLCASSGGSKSQPLRQEHFGAAKSLLHGEGERD